MKTIIKTLALTCIFISNVSCAVNHSAVANANEKLLTPSKPFNLDEHIISTSFFHWYTSTGGQTIGPWLPIEGRTNWTGETDWWKGQIKQVMRSGIDVLYVHLLPHMEQQRTNLFRALYEMRCDGYDVPKVAPFLDTVITWGKARKYSFAVESNRTMFVDQYVRFFDQYYSVNTDKYADDYIDVIDGRVVLDVWHLWVNLTDHSNFHRAFIEKALAEKFGTKHPVFTNGIYLITTDDTRTFSFADEKVVQFHSQEYCHITDFNNMKAAQLKPGYWDQNVRNPGFILKRDGGIHYSNAWMKLNPNDVKRVYIESWNEYAEGSGIYAANPTNIFRTNSNKSIDVWSSSNDPFEYIKTSYNGAKKFKRSEIKNKNSKILYHNLPGKMVVGETNKCTVYVRNTGFDLWKSSDGFTFGQKLCLTNEMPFGTGRYGFDNVVNEVDFYDGIFKGRPVKFDVTVIAPEKTGKYVTHWGMLQEGVKWFGEEITNTIIVIEQKK